MNTTASKRILREIDDMKKHPISGISLIMDPNNTFHMTALLDGPSESVYEDGQFLLDIMFPNDYPFKPPLVKFKTPVFHPNVDGENICLDILKSHWSPALKIQQVILSISSFLVDPCPENGFGNQATATMKSNINEFNKIARNWVKTHAQKKEQAPNQESVIV